MFVVIFEVQPKAAHWDEYLALAKQLKPKLEAIDGFIDNERFGSTRTQGRLLSLSTWRDEKAVVRWRTHGEHHGVQEKGRFEVFADYHLRVGEVTADTHPPTGLAVEQQRFDATAVGAAKAATITEITPKAGHTVAAEPARFGFDAVEGLVDRELFESIYAPGRLLLLASWRTAEDARAWTPAALPAAAQSPRPHHPRLRHVRPPRGAAVLSGRGLGLRGGERGGVGDDHGKAVRQSRQCPFVHDLGRRHAPSGRVRQIAGRGCLRDDGAAIAEVQRRPCCRADAHMRGETRDDQLLAAGLADPSMEIRSGEGVRERLDDDSLAVPRREGGDDRHEGTLRVKCRTAGAPMMNDMEDRNLPRPRQIEQARRLSDGSVDALQRQRARHVFELRIDQHKDRAFERAGMQRCSGNLKQRLGQGIHGTPVSTSSFAFQSASAVIPPFYRTSRP
jgi:heme-degrading monooxygenase HmoA